MPTLLEQLAVKHPYYCSDSNYYSNQAGQSFNTIEDFLKEFGEADVDFNLCFRWDIKPHDWRDLSEGYYAEVFLILQRKGIFKPIHIETVIEDQLPAFHEYLQKHKNTLDAIWKPF